VIVALCASRGLRPQVLFLPTSLVAYAALATHQWLDVGPFAASPDPYELPAQAGPLCPTCQAFRGALCNARVSYMLCCKRMCIALTMLPPPAVYVALRLSCLTSRLTCACEQDALLRTARCRPVGCNLTPSSELRQVEILFAALWSVSAWRGIYTGLRPYI